MPHIILQGSGRSGIRTQSLGPSSDAVLLREVVTDQEAAALVESTGLVTAPEETSVSESMFKQVGFCCFARSCLLSLGMAAALTARAVPAPCFRRSTSPSLFVFMALPFLQLCEYLIQVAQVLGKLSGPGYFLPQVRYFPDPPAQFAFPKLSEYSHGPNLSLNLVLPYWKTKTLQ